jgi:hypothetical protein
MKQTIALVAATSSLGEGVLVRRLWLLGALAAAMVAVGMLAGVVYRDLRASEQRMSVPAIWHSLVRARSELAAAFGLLLLAAIVALGAAGQRVVLPDGTGP